jgi:glycosyltransferase involved in cell wall biosynthesis
MPLITLTRRMLTINDVLIDDNLRNSLIEKGHQQVKKYSWQRMATQTHDVYMNALGSR